MKKLIVFIIAFMLVLTMFGQSRYQELVDLYGEPNFEMDGTYVYNRDILFNGKYDFQTAFSFEDDEKTIVVGVKGIEEDIYEAFDLYYMEKLYERELISVYGDNNFLFRLDRERNSKECLLIIKERKQSITH